MKNLVIATFIALGIASVAAANQPQLSDQIRQLASCQSSMLTVQAEMMDGKLTNWESVKKEIEAVNPGFILDLKTKKITTKE